MNNVQRWLLIVAMLSLEPTLVFGSEIFIEDSSLLRPIGRVVENKQTGETLQFVCLEDFNERKLCAHFQLVKNEKSFVGLPMIVRLVPKEEFKEQLIRQSDVFYKDRRWKYRWLPFGHLISGTKWNGEKMIADTGEASDALAHDLIGVGLTGMAGFAAAGLSDAAFGYYFMGLATIPALEAALMTPHVITVTQRMVNRIQRNKARQKLKRAIDQSFDLLRIDEGSFRLSDRDFKTYEKVMNVLLGAQE